MPNLISNNTTNVIFWHICGINDWELIVRDQLRSIENSGLLDNISKCFVTYLGNNKNEISWLVKANKKIVLSKYSDNLYEYERLCLHDMLSWSKKNKANILYIHAKGVSRGNDDAYIKNNIWEWRKMMEFFLIENYQICLKNLVNNDAIGCNLIDMGNFVCLKDEKHRLHFSGNFWWSKTDHIKTLPRIAPNINDLRKNETYLLCERWVLSKYPDMKIYEIYNYPYYKDKRFYYHTIKRSDYEDVI